ncbi:MAG: AAA family ATPase, partial [Lachnospiraceae bacterium]|nr:AAA family ATPase [Lachnospiraceae bacterium]
MVLKGYLEHFLFRNEDNGYTVFNLAMEEEDVTCVGSFKSIEQGETLEVTGEFTDHPTYGEQFKVEEYKIIPPEDRIAMERYLGSGAIKGLGEALAKRIVKAFGNDTFRIIEEEPERLIEIKGISERKARDIAIQMMEKKDLREAMLFLQKYGISNTLAIKIYKEYGTDIYSFLKENPYKIAEDISGVGFKIADDIARKIGIKTDSDFRIRSGLLYTLLQAVNEGHTYLPVEVLKEKAGVLLGIDKEYLSAQISNLAMDKKIMLKTYNDKVYAYAMSLYFAEQNCARKLWELNIPFSDGDSYVKTKVEKMQDDSGVFLDELQKKAVVESVCNGVFILTGGPGTGKTTTINAMIRYFESEGLEFYLAAPTGRAAKRMTETTGYEARTLHRLLELNGRLEGETAFSAGFEKNEDNPIEADVVIVDEMSMVDMFIFQALLKALIPGTRLIMVGDVNQLPSVGPGQVLHDLIESGCFKVVMLETIFIPINVTTINSLAFNGCKSLVVYCETSSWPSGWKNRWN